MIFYFSGTGNSKWVAENIAEKINDRICSISEIKEVPEIQGQNQIGFIFPIYAWGIPEPMRIFAKRLKKENVFSFGICTCGANAGIALKQFSKIYSLDSCYSVIMPNNYIIGGDIEEESIILKKLEEAKMKLEKISNEIIERKKVYCVEEGKFAVLKSTIVNKGFNKFARSTKFFYVDKEKCNGCGLCVKECPASTIKLIDGNPVWNKKCYQCLHCINSCPKLAIQYGRDTEGRGRYNIKKYFK